MWPLRDTDKKHYYFASLPHAKPNYMKKQSTCCLHLLLYSQKNLGRLLSMRNYQHKHGPSNLSCFIKDFCGPNVQYSLLNMTSSARYSLSVVNRQLYFTENNSTNKRRECKSIEKV